MEMKGLMGGLYRITEWIMRFSVTNLLWLITAIPFFFLGTPLLFSEAELDTGSVFSVLLLMAAAAPFTLFPSTSAMFSMVRKWLTGEEDAPLLKTFFKSYKQNYVQSMLGGLLYTVLIALLIVNYRFYLNLDNGFQVLSILFIVLMLLVIISMFNFFCILAHLHMKTIAIVKNAVLLTMGKPFTSLFIVITNGFIAYICITQFNMFLAFFFMGSLIAYMTFFHFNRMFEKIQEKQQALLEAEEAEAEKSTGNN